MVCSLVKLLLLGAFWAALSSQQQGVAGALTGGGVRQADVSTPEQLINALIQPDVTTIYLIRSIKLGPTDWNTTVAVDRNVTLTSYSRDVSNLPVLDLAPVFGKIQLINRATLVFDRIYLMNYRCV